MKNLILLIAAIIFVSCETVSIEPTEESKGKIQPDTTEWTRENFPDCKP